jgi:ureidoacrylate peracid hydrolase
VIERLSKDLPGNLESQRKRMLTTLEAKVLPTHTALLVIDMQNDFCAPGGMMDKEGLDLAAVQVLTQRLPAFIEVARAAGVLVTFVRNVYTTDANWYLSDVWLEQAQRRRVGSYIERPVCSPGSWNGDFCGEVRPREGDPVITKHRFSAFHNTDLNLVLRSHGVRSVVLTGVATNVCVETTARDAFMNDYYVVFVKDGSATYSEAEHAATLATIDRYFGQVVSMADLRVAWR